MNDAVYMAFCETGLVKVREIAIKSLLCNLYVVFGVRLFVLDRGVVARKLN
jgi:hypothetical protein